MRLQIERRNIAGRIGFCILFCFSVPFAQATPDDTYELANNSFRKGEFVEASEQYEALIEAGHFSKTLFFNLGTALYRAGSPGEGVLWFRRARILSPGMAEVHQDMEFLRNKLGFLEFSQSKTDRFLLRIPPALPRWISALGIWVVAFAVISLVFVRRLDRSRRSILVAMVFAVILSAASIWINNYRTKNLAVENFATITSPDAKAFTAPVPNSKSIIDLPPGSEVKILQDSDHWIYVAIPGDLRGWVRSENLEPVWPVPTKIPTHSK